MRIVLVSLNGEATGVASGLRARSLAKYLGRCGHSIELICCASTSIASKEPFGQRICVPMVRHGTDAGLAIINRLVNRLVYWPDPERRWVAPVMQRLKELCSDQKPDLMLVSSPPHSIQLIGILGAGQFGVPYVADLRDDWVTNHRHRWHTPFHRLVAAHYERRMVESAACVVLNTQLIEERFGQRYPRHKDKFATVTNGYDDDDFSEAYALDLINDDRKVIAYTGGMYGSFFSSRLSDLAAGLKRIGLHKQWRLVTAGPAFQPPFCHGDVWTHLGLLCPQGAASLMTRADLLVAGMPPGEREPSGTVPLKLYSYLRAGKPIVYYGETGSANDVLMKYSGTFVKHRNEWSRFPFWLQAQHLEETYDRTGVERYSFGNLTKELMMNIQRRLDVRRSCGSPR
ncbi:MAG: glycosyltransferase [Thermoguttaceae bacterium]|jgi:glycosyltransferase involved in cell wall biosynthesis